MRIVARPRDAHARRPRLRPRAARARARPPGAVHAAARRGVSARAARGRRRDRASATSLRAVHTPGHRPEHCCFAVIDRTRADEPWLVLTGDSLFVGDAARPDLAVEAREGAEGLFHSLHRLLELGDGVEVYPGHVAGSLCGKAMSSKASTTIGFERRFNHALRSRRRRVRRRVGSVRSRRGRRTWSASSSSTAAPSSARAAARASVGPGDARRARRAAGADASPPVTSRARSTCPSPARASRRRPAFVLARARRSSSTRPTQDEADARSARPARRRVPRRSRAALPRRRRRARRRRSRSTSSSALLAAGDDRSASTCARRTSATRRFSPGAATSRTASCGGGRDGLRGRRPIVTICETGARAAVAASVLAGDRRRRAPRAAGGIADWRARGGEHASFRRCGGR